MIQECSLIKKTLKAIESMFFSKALRSLPINLFSVTEINEAFQYLQKSRHIGKVIISFSNTLPLFYKEHTYLITGAFGGIGSQIAEWILNNGGKNLVLVGHKRKPHWITIETHLENLGGKFETVETDVSSYDGCAKAVHNSKNLRGIFHCAGVISDGLVVNQSWEKFQKVFGSKVLGTTHFHELTKSMNLKYFVLFSSVAALLGTRGQSNHAAASAYMDSIAQYRVGGLGLKATSINWGPWSDIGAGAFSKHYSSIGHLKPTDGLAALEQVIRSRITKVAIAEIQGNIKSEFPVRVDYLCNLDIAKFRGTQDAPMISYSVENFQKLSEQFSNRSSREVSYEDLESLVEGTFRLCSGNSDGKVNRKRSFTEMGMDSLMAMEMRAKLGKFLSTQISYTEFSQNDTVATIGTFLKLKLQNNSEI